MRYQRNHIAMQGGVWPQQQPITNRQKLQKDTSVWFSVIFIFLMQLAG